MTSACCAGQRGVDYIDIGALEHEPESTPVSPIIRF
jgi:hypothetical protein